MSDRTMVIPAPVVYPDEFCMVLNYRKKHGEIWEKGCCISAEFKCNYREPKNTGKIGWWQYTVILNRRNPVGNCMRLYVSDDGIRPITDADVEA